MVKETYEAPTKCITDDVTPSLIEACLLIIKAENYDDVEAAKDAAGKALAKAVRA